MSVIGRKGPEVRKLGTCRVNVIGGLTVEARLELQGPPLPAVGLAVLAGTVPDGARLFETTALVPKAETTRKIADFLRQSRREHGELPTLPMDLPGQIRLHPAVAPGLVAPGLVARGLVARGLVAPGLVAPGLVAPGLVARGLVAVAEVCIGEAAGPRGGEPWCQGVLLLALDAAGAPVGWID